jgi:hypothetical protein
VCGTLPMKECNARAVVSSPASASGQDPCSRRLLGGDLLIDACTDPA